MVVFTDARNADGLIAKQLEESANKRWSKEGHVAARQVRSVNLAAQRLQAGGQAL
jgi:hypothetical protein